MGDMGPVPARVSVMPAAAEMAGWYLGMVAQVLAVLYPDEASMRRVASSAGLALGWVRFNGIANDCWYGILVEAQRCDLVGELLAVVLSEYGEYEALTDAVQLLGVGGG
jgi:hypothetical protein